MALILLHQMPLVIFLQYRYLLDIIGQRIEYLLSTGLTSITDQTGGDWIVGHLSEWYGWG